ncbi:LOW QUALITY PROTEIN: hypothetical protein Cgig2_017977 [Carnegiea gigantea]|uniref:Aminotransferase-like plant mobile domain-containing protein n=1 Tax=Carnegiea gigantea TaxID=171969 RepID=A0A9Q1Q596_9CARY|nr:LOW QUALITY PROTEIN: hypothetical protein Cgig2_017977 [Carnegiea gigantea]
MDDSKLLSLLDHEKVSNRQSKPQTAKDWVTQYSEDTLSNATVTKKVQFRQKHVEFEELAIVNVELSIIRTKSWTTLLQHIMAPGGCLNLVERLDYEQWLAIMEIGFGGILAMRTRLILKRLARWLLEKYDPWDTLLNLPNGKLLIDEEDVYVTLGLPMGQLEISEGQSSQTDIKWNIERGGPPIGSMHEVILERGGHRHEFITDLLAYAISTCIVRNANGTCHFPILKYLHNLNEIHNYNWCAYVIKCLNDAISEWKGDKSKFFMGPLLFLMVSTFDKPISLIAQFRAKKVERWFLVVINWLIKKVRKRDRDEQLPGEHGRGRIIERIDYHIITCLAEIWRCTYKNCKRTNPNREDLVICPQQLQLESNDVHIVDIAMDNFKMLYLLLVIQCRNLPILYVQDDMTTVAQAQQGRRQHRCILKALNPILVTQLNVADYLSLDDTYYYSLEFLKQVDQLESMAREKM